MWMLLNHTGTPNIYNRSWQVCTSRFFLTLIALKFKCFGFCLNFSLIHNKFLGRCAKNWIFHQNNILHYFFSKSVNVYLITRCTSCTCFSLFFPRFWRKLSLILFGSARRWTSPAAPHRSKARDSGQWHEWKHWQYWKYCYQCQYCKYR
jgi:hypothetical protein